MKVLQVNCVYQKGSTGKIVYDIHRVLQDEKIESVICYGRGEKIDGAYKICSEFYAKCNNLRSRLTGLMYGGCYLSTAKLTRIIQKEQPDVVHLHCINGYFVNIYRLITWLKKNKIRTVLTLHAEFMHTGNCGYSVECEQWKTGCKKCPRWKADTGSLFFNRTHASWEKMRKAFDGFEHLKIASVSPWLMERAKQSPILKKLDHTVVFNGVDTAIFRLYDTKELRKQHGLENKKVIFYATAEFSTDPSHMKGGYYALEIAKRLPDVTMIVAAGRCNEEIDWPKNVIYLGRISDQKLLAQYYAMADVCLLTSMRETFSMPTAESMCCGTPVIGFEAGAPETIALAQHSRFVKHGDLDALEQALSSQLEKTKNPTISADAEKRYAKKVMAQNYIALYKELTR